MEPLTTCPVCHLEVRSTDYFCFNCGKNLRPVPPTLAVFGQIKLYIGSILLPPMGVFWGLPYLRQPDLKRRLVGWIAVILTVSSLLWAIKSAVDFGNQLTTQINSQMQSLGGYGF